MSAKSASKAGEQGTRPSADRYAAPLPGRLETLDPPSGFAGILHLNGGHRDEGRTEVADLDARHDPYIRRMTSA